MKVFAFLCFSSVLSMAHPMGQGAAGLQRPKSEIKKNKTFYRQDDIKCFACLRLQSKSAAEIS
jgi:hypothetical protein